MLRYLVIVHHDHHDRQGSEPGNEFIVTSLNTGIDSILTCRAALNSIAPLSEEATGGRMNTRQAWA